MHPILKEGRSYVLKVIQDKAESCMMTFKEKGLEICDSLIPRPGNLVQIAWEWDLEVKLLKHNLLKPLSDHSNAHIWIYVHDCICV